MPRSPFSCLTSVYHHMWYRGASVGMLARGRALFRYPTVRGGGREKYRTPLTCNISLRECGKLLRLAEFAEPLRVVRPDIWDAELDALQRALRHAMIGAALARSATASGLRRELRSIAELRLLAQPRVGGNQAVAG